MLSGLRGRPPPLRLSRRVTALVPPRGRVLIGRPDACRRASPGRQPAGPRERRLLASPVAHRPRALARRRGRPRGAPHSARRGALLAPRSQVRRRLHPFPLRREHRAGRGLRLQPGRARPRLRGHPVEPDAGGARRAAPARGAAPLLHDRRQLWRALGATLLLPLLVYLWAWVYFGFPLANSTIAKRIVYSPPPLYALRTCLEELADGLRFARLWPRGPIALHWASDARVVLWLPFLCLGYLVVRRRAPAAALVVAQPSGARAFY